LNTANGSFALFTNTTGFSNTAVGDRALFANTNGTDNTALGVNALRSSIGDLNTAVGAQCLLANTTGSQNTGIGNFALANNTGNGNIGLGVNAGNNVTTADNIICIGSGVLGANVSNTCLIGNIRDVTTQNADALPVVIDSAGQLGTVSSSRRFKQQITPMDKASESILALEPVTFHYKSDKTDTAQFGLIAEEVAKANPDLVARDKNGEIYTVRYDAVNAMLLNEFLKEHRKVQEQNNKIQEQEATITELKSTLAQQQKGLQTVTARLEQQAAQIQKVSAQLEASKSAPLVVNTP
jgi:Chaperone of endosialidase